MSGERGKAAAAGVWSLSGSVSASVTRWGSA